MAHLEARSQSAQPQPGPPRDGPAAFSDPDATIGIRTGVPRRWRWPVRILSLLLTLLAVGLAALLTWRMWEVYMGAPWTRDATVRAYVVTMAPQVAGRIVGLPVVDNQYVRKGDLLMEIDPTDYQIGVSEAEATVQQIGADVHNIDAQIAVQQAQIAASQAKVEEAQAALVFGKQQAARYQDLARKGYGTVQNSQLWTSQQSQQEASLRSGQASLQLAQRQVVALEAQRRSTEANLAQAKAQLRQAQVNLERTRIVSPVNGYVTNLLAQPGNYVNVGVITISVVDANSFWVDGYFEETNIAPIRVGDPAQIRLMGYRETLHGYVDSIARAINVSNAQPNDQGVATVNPIFTWVRLAQRIPVRIHIDKVPPEVILAAGMTVTVQIGPRHTDREGLLSRQ
ncbi:MAG TPA: HlyD family secretion protein [Hyphomicrobiaceae bacterium]|nr:HlyD family secretion protein [Hyphomicrobiaceae bacterium]